MVSYRASSRQRRCWHARRDRRPRSDLLDSRRRMVSSGSIRIGLRHRRRDCGLLLLAAPRPDLPHPRVCPHYRWARNAVCGRGDLPAHLSSATSGDLCPSPALPAASVQQPASPSSTATFLILLGPSVPSLASSIAAGERFSKPLLISRAVGNHANPRRSRIRLDRARAPSEPPPVRAPEAARS